jgi:hypothetical protein
VPGPGQRHLRTGRGGHHRPVPAGAALRQGEGTVRLLPSLVVHRTRGGLGPMLPPLLLAWAQCLGGQGRARWLCRLLLHPSRSVRRSAFIDGGAHISRPLAALWASRDWRRDISFALPAGERHRRGSGPDGAGSDGGRPNARRRGRPAGGRPSCRRGRLTSLPADWSASPRRSCSWSRAACSRSRMRSAASASC